MAKLTGSVVPKSATAAMPYPGRVIKRGEKDGDIVRAVQTRLNETGCGPIGVDGDFGADTERSVKLFQIRFADQDGGSLKVDGQVGPMTWGMLFGTRSVPTADKAPSKLLAGALAFAATQIGVMEQPLGSNRGPEVDAYLRSVGLDPTKGAYAWCAAFVYYCFQQAATRLGRANPVVKTAGVLDHWSKAGKAGVPRIFGADALNNPALVKPGHIFILDYGGGAGHTGLVESVNGGKLVTIEGNTNDGGSREGIGVFRRTSRKIADVKKGFIDYSTL